MAKMDLSLGTVETDIKGAVDFGFSSKNAKKLAGMMANFLYSDKEYAVISELSANAYDAHRMIGKPELPIKVNMPTNIEQELIIRDFGPGMSESDVYKYLTQFGESSKQEDNDQVGFWGIGSKSPAAVTSNWSIISHHNGKKMHFEVFINDEGVPSLKKIFEGETDTSGLEVRVPVENNKFGVWENAARKAFKRYDVRPTMNRNISIPEVEYTYREATYGIRTVRSGSENVCIVTTGREYVLDATKIATLIKDPVINAMLTSRIDLFFNIGEIDLSISREQIQYNAKTTAALLKRLEEVALSIKNKFLSNLAVAKNGVEYRQILSELWKWNLRTVLTNIIAGNKYGVVNLPNDFTQYTVAWDRTKYPIRVIYRGATKQVGATRSFNCFGTYAVSYGEKYEYNTRTYVHNVSIKIDYVDKVRIVLRDGVNDAAARLVEHGDPSLFYILIEDNIFGPEFATIKASKLQKRTRTYTKRVGALAGDSYRLYKRSFSKLTEHEFSTLDKEKTVSIKMSDARTIDAEGNEAARSAEVSFLQKEGYVIIGHKKSGNAFSTPDEAIKKLIAELKSSPEVKKDIENAKIRAVISGLSAHPALTALVSFNIENDFTKSLFKEIASTVALIKAKNYKLNGYTPYDLVSDNAFIKRLKRALSVIDEKYEPIGQIDFEAINKVACNRYPMLKYMGSRDYAHLVQVEDCKAYITMIENQGV